MTSNTACIAPISTGNHPAASRSGLAKIKGKIEHVLDDIDARYGGPFATSGRLPEAVDPGLYVNGLGSIDLPLSRGDAARLISESHRAPFGRGSQTIVDTNVRRTWELDATQFSLRNPQWQETLSRVCDRVREKLDLCTAFRPELYKLLIYEKGAFFHEHREQVYFMGLQYARLTMIQH